MARTLFPEFRDQFETTKYPFTEQASLRNERGDTILHGTFLDAHIYPIGGEARMYVSQIDVEFERVRLSIGDARNPVRCFGEYETTDLPEKLLLQDPYGRPAGILITEPSRIAVFQSWGIGNHGFRPTQTEFLATCCMPTPAIGVRGIVLEDRTLLTGRFWVVGDDGVVVRHEQQTREAECDRPEELLEIIRVDVVGDPLYRRRLCVEPDLFVTPRPIQRIRFVDPEREVECGPNEFGNITIQGNDLLASKPAVRIRQTEQGLVVEVAGTNMMV